MDHQIGELIKTLNQGIKALPQGVSLMMKQYVVTGYVFATIFFIVAIVFGIVAFRVFAKMQNQIGQPLHDEYDKGEYSFDHEHHIVDRNYSWKDEGLSLIIPIANGLVSVMFFSFAMSNLYHALNPIVSLINQVK